MKELVLCRFRSAHTGRIYQQYVLDGVDAWNLMRNLLHDGFINSAKDFKWTVIFVNPDKIQALIDSCITEVEL